MCVCVCVLLFLRIGDVFVVVLNLTQYGWSCFFTGTLLLQRFTLALLVKSIIGWHKCLETGGCSAIESSVHMQVCDTCNSRCPAQLEDPLPNIAPHPSWYSIHFVFLLQIVK